MLNSAAPSSSTNRKLHRAATVAKAVLSELGRIAWLSSQLRQAPTVTADYAEAHVNPGCVSRTLEAADQFVATLKLQQPHRGAFAFAASV